MPRNALMDVLQSASNSIAGNLSGPVDLLGWGLRKAGVPVPENAVGSSQWMRERGFTSDVPQGVNQLAGETLGLLSPFAPTGKIAAGLVRAGENAAIPRTLNPQTGAIVYHGSPHKFDKFDSSKIGTGEGAQAYGHGLYLADEPTVAKTYAGINGPVGQGPAQQELVNLAMKKAGGDRVKAKSLIHDWAQKATGWNKQQFNDAYNNFNAIIDTPPGQLYKVDLPDEQIAKMLDWDKPLSQQPEAVKALRKVAPRFPGLSDALQSFELGSTTGETVNRYMSRVADPNAAASAFREAGIPGIRYLDGGSRSAGQGSSNYVVFPGNEGLLTILERNGEQLPGVKRLIELATK